MSQFEADVATAPTAIAEATERVMDFLTKTAVDARATHHVALVLEEFLTNIATHGGGPAEPAKVRIAVEAGRVVGEILDSGSPYDPRKSPAPDLTAKLEDRPIGGLGLYLVTQLTSELDYESKDGRDRTAFAIARVN